MSTQELPMQAGAELISNSQSDSLAAITLADLGAEVMQDAFRRYAGALNARAAVSPDLINSTSGLELFHSTEIES